MTLLRIYIPTKNKESKRVLESIRRKYLDQTKKQFSALFGGYSEISHINGGYNGNNGLIEESVTIIESHTEKDQKDFIESITQLATELKDKLNQESIMIQIIETEKALFI